ncbi:dihydroorotase [Candidatus Peregrinibacteria bacterium]|nr:dihydroorotase [Candidatus Peregrinibacteria bacterium]
MSKILLKNGQVGCALGVYDADVLIENGKIVNTFDWGGKHEADEIIDCKGKLILPGLIDVHVHLREPGQKYKEDWITGTKAAVAGGVTTVCDMPNNVPPIFTLADLEAKRKLVAKRAYCNYGLYMGFNGQNFGEINKAKNIPAVKIYVANSTGNLGVSEETIRELFKKSNKMIVAHAEDDHMIQQNIQGYLSEYGATMGEDGKLVVPKDAKIDPSLHSKIRSAECAASAVKFLCELARENQRKLHIAHVSSDQELTVLLEYQDIGVTCEVAPHHLLLSEDDYEKFGNLIKVNPPVRSKMDLFTMWKALKFGEVQIIATDHAPHTLLEKELGYMEAPSGIPELDTLLPILLNAVNDGGLEIKEVVKLCCEGPAKIFGIKNKGQVEAGFDADLVVVDMEKEFTVKNEKLFTKCKWSPYNGSTFKGCPVMTFVNGELVYKNGKIVGKKVGREIGFGEM